MQVKVADGRGEIPYDFILQVDPYCPPEMTGCNHAPFFIPRNSFSVTAFRGVQVPCCADALSNTVLCSARKPSPSCRPTMTRISRQASSTRFYLPALPSSLFHALGQTQPIPSPGFPRWTPRALMFASKHLVRMTPY